MRAGRPLNAREPAELVAEALEQALGANRREVGAVTVEHAVTLERAALPRVAEQVERVDVAHVGQSPRRPLESLNRLRPRLERLPGNLLRPR